MPGADMGIDLGTSNTLIYLSGKGIMLNEPSVIAVDQMTDEVIAMGREAYAMIGRTSDRVRVFSPVENGVISDYEYTYQMLTSFMNHVSNNALFNPRVVLCIPGKTTEVERRAAVDAVRKAGTRRICLLDEAVASALGAGLDITGLAGCAVVDIGGGTVDMAVMSLGGISVSRSATCAGDALDHALIQYLRSEKCIWIGKRMAQQAKEAIGCAIATEDRTFTVRGRNVLNGLPTAFTVHSADMEAAYAPVLSELIAEVTDMLEHTPPELLGDLMESGVMLTGGGALLDGIDRLLSESTHLRFIRAEKPLECVAIGAGKALKYLDVTEMPNGISVNPLTEV